MEKAKFQWMSNRTADGAGEYLEAIQQRSTMLQLYQHYYPDEYQQSRASPRFTSHATYTEKELEFLTSVDQQFFPLPIELTEFERTSYIPVEPLGTSWYYEEFDELGVTEKFLMCLIHGIENDTWNELEEEMGKDLPIAASYINYQKLGQEAQKLKGIIANLPVALDMLTQSTGNIWLDITYESDIVDSDWKVETIDALREAYTEAKVIMENYRQFIDWLDQDSQNCVKVVRLWNRCKEPNPSLHPRYLTSAQAA
jgi:hypothetical protein